MVASTAAMKAIRAARDVMGNRADRLITLLPVHPIRGPSSDGTGGSHATLHFFTRRKSSVHHMLAGMSPPLHLLTRPPDSGTSATVPENVPAGTWSAARIS